MRRHRSRTASAAVLGALVTAGLSSLPARAQSAGEWGSSEQLWQVTCRYCHDNRVAGELRGAGLTPQAIVTAVRTGPKAMPSFTPSQISDHELDQLAQWVALQKAPAPSPALRERTPRHSTRQRER
jgi:hypothetical protein